MDGRILPSYMLFWVDRGVQTRGLMPQICLLNSFLILHWPEFCSFQLVSTVLTEEFSLTYCCYLSVSMGKGGLGAFYSAILLTLFHLIVFY